MKLTSKAEVDELANAYLSSAALNSALELGLFWELAHQPQSAAQIAALMQIPPARCRAWLEVLRDLGLLEKEDEAYAVSPLARTAILEQHSQPTQSFLAWQRRTYYGAGMDLALHIRFPGSVWEAQGVKTPDDYDLVRENPVWAEQFTRMLDEVHRPLAKEVADLVDMSDVRRMLDLGGGSGVMSFVFLRKYPKLTSVVAELENVCRVGRAIAVEKGLGDRISYLGIDLANDDLPTGFDLVLQCDLAMYSVEHLRKIRNALKPKGRVLIVQGVDAPRDGSSPYSAVEMFRWSLGDPNYCVWTLEALRQALTDARFEYRSERMLSTGETLLEAYSIELNSTSQ